MSREMFNDAHEELVEEMMEETGCSWSEAYEKTADAAYDRMCGNLADRIDHIRQLQKDKGL